jgi:hypothetical protein
MCRHRALSIAFFVSAAALSFTSAARADFADMLRRVPGDANVLVLIDAEQILASPLAKSEGWREKREADYQARPLTFPPQTTKLIRAAQFDMDTHESKWQVAILEAARIPSLDQIAKKVQGHLDNVANTSAVWSPRGWYAFKIGNQALGVVFPANRQYLSRWIKSPPGRVSSYLQKATEARNAKSLLLVAVDFDDVVQPQRLAEHLKKLDSLKDAKNLEEIADTFATIQGVRFEVSIQNKAFGKLTLDFAKNPSALSKVAKPLVLEALGDAGLYIDDLEDWSASVDGKSVSLNGELSHSALMRMSSLLELPSPPLDDSGRDADQADSGNPKLYATQDYFKSIQTLVNDLLQEKNKAKSLGNYAAFVDQYARRIDQLPLLNVDPDMQDYGLFVVQALRQGSTSFKGAGVNTGARSAGVWGSNYDYYGNQISGSNSAVTSERRAIKAEEQAASVTTGLSLREQVAGATSKIRRLMTERYKVNF